GSGDNGPIAAIALFSRLCHHTPNSSPQHVTCSRKTVLLSLCGLSPFYLVGDPQGSLHFPNPGEAVFSCSGRYGVVMSDCTIFVVSPDDGPTLTPTLPSFSGKLLITCIVYIITIHRAIGNPTYRPVGLFSLDPLKL